MKIHKDGALVILLYVALLRLDYLPYLVTTGFKIIVVCLVGLYLVKHVQYINISKNIYIIAFASVIMLSSFLNNGIALNAFQGVLYALGILEMFLLCENTESKHLAGPMLFIALLLVIVTDLLIIFTSGNLEYFVGSKFQVSYLHIWLACMYAFKFKEYKRFAVLHKFIVIGLFLFSAIISNKVECATGTIASLFGLLFYVLPNGIWKFLSKPKTVILTILIATAVVFMIENLLENTSVQFFIQQLLGRNLTLTGRLRIYDALFEIVKQKPLLGYGYGDRIVAEVIGYGNAQNGLMHIIVQFGLLGALFFLLMTNKAIQMSMPTYKDMKPVYMVMYCLIICATVEISFNLYFFMSLAILQERKTKLAMPSELPGKPVIMLNTK